MQKNNEVATLTTNDLQSAGINSQLSSNDLVEVVAHDIYNKYLDSINDMVKRGDLLHDKYYKLFDSEVDKMKTSLAKYLKKDAEVLKVDEDDYLDDDYVGVSVSFGKVDEYWPGMSIRKVSINEKDKGTTVDTNDRHIATPSLKGNKSVAVKLTIQTPNETKSIEVKVGKISGTVDTTSKKIFTQVINVPTTRFKAFANEVGEHNKQVSLLMSNLPKNGVLSVERFTRDARVKMNKKIISAQSPDFKDKISALFNIKL